MTTNPSLPTYTDGPGTPEPNPSDTGRVPDAERLARVGLGAVAEPRDPAVTRLRERYSVREVWDGLRSGDLHVDGITVRKLAESDPASVLERGDEAGARAVVPGDGEWPRGMADRLGPAMPPVLWIKSDSKLPQFAPAVAVTGSRAATQYGEYVAAEMAAGLVEHGWTVWSGAAYGCDARAHRGALAAGGKTVALLACGLGQVYPRGHGELFADIVARGGALVSELPPYATPTRHRFIARCGLLTAFTAGLVVVEAGRASSIVRTAAQAMTAGRKVFAVPGPVTSGLSNGCHDLIRDGARLAVDADQVHLALTT